MNIKKKTFLLDKYCFGFRFKDKRLLALSLSIAGFNSDSLFKYMERNLETNVKYCLILQFKGSNGYVIHDGVIEFAIEGFPIDKDSREVIFTDLSNLISTLRKNAEDA